MSGAEPEAVARALYAAFAKGDRDRAEHLITADFTFTSPYDDAIDRAAYFERCWPNAQQVAALEVERTARDGDGVFVTYLFTAKSGAQFRNTEYLIVADGQVRAAHVYFGAGYRDGVFQAKSPEG